MLKRVALALIGLVVGFLAIALFIGIGEGTGSGIAAFGAVSLLFALITFGLSRADPDAWWVYAVVTCLPMIGLSLMAPGGDYFLGALVMVAITLIGARLGATSRTAAPMM